MDLQKPSFHFCFYLREFETEAAVKTLQAFEPLQEATNCRNMSWKMKGDLAGGIRLKWVFREGTEIQTGTG